MRKKDYRGMRCVKQTYSKCEGICRTYDQIQTALVAMLEVDDSVKSFQCNVCLEDLEDGAYASDVVAVKTDGTLMVRECVWRKKLNNLKTARLLDKSRNYWLSKGVTDWGIVIERKEDSHKGEAS